MKTKKRWFLVLCAKKTILRPNSWLNRGKTDKKAAIFGLENEIIILRPKKRRILCLKRGYYGKASKYCVIESDNIYDSVFFYTGR